MDSNVDNWINTHCLNADVFVLVVNSESVLMRVVSVRGEGREGEKGRKREGGKRGKQILIGHQYSTGYYN